MLIRYHFGFNPTIIGFALSMISLKQFKITKNYAEFENFQKKKKKKHLILVSRTVEISKTPVDNVS